MKRTIIALIFTALLVSLNVFADNSKLTKIDIDVKTTNIVKADLDIDDFYYYIDTNACICWLSNLIGGTSAITAVDCSKLAAHPRLEQYVSKCAAKPVEVNNEQLPVAEKNQEAVKSSEQTTDKKKK